MTVRDTWSVQWVCLWFLLLSKMSVITYYNICHHGVARANKNNVIQISIQSISEKWKNNSLWKFPGTFQPVYSIIVCSSSFEALILNISYRIRTQYLDGIQTPCEGSLFSTNRLFFLKVDFPKLSELFENVITWPKVRNQNIAKLVARAQMLLLEFCF